MKKGKKFFKIVARRPKMALGVLLFAAVVIEAIIFLGFNNSKDRFSKFLVCLGITFASFILAALVCKITVRLYNFHFSIRKYFLSKPIYKVSAVIPNYNYANYLKERVESIISQTYPIYELVILDDASTDDSKKVIKEIIADLKIRCPDLKVKFVPNKKNSGNVFKQWEKSFDESTGDFVWICEADDSCNKHFLNYVMRSFNKKEVVLSYAESCAIDEDGKRTMPDFRSWIDRFGTGHWNKSYTIDGEKELRKYMCTNNTIANVSSVVFRRIDAPINKYLREAQKFRLVGDWYFYAKYLLNGKIAYHAESLNYHRMQDKGVTLTTDKYKQFLEITAVQDSIEKDIELDGDDRARVQNYREEVIDIFGMSERELELAAAPFDKILRKSKVSDKVLLSVVVCAYNVEDYIEACLKSVKNALPEKSEIIVVDDGSTDGTAEVVKKFRKKNSGIRYFFKKNGGLASAKNFGLSKAKGRYVIFMDADDKIRSDGYQTMLKLALKEDADIVVCDMALIYDDRTINCHVYHEDPGELKGFLIDGLMASSNNKMIKRDIYKKVGKYPEGKNNEDVAITPVLMALSKKTRYIPSAFYEYYQREGSIQNSEFTQKRLAIFDTVKCADLAIQKILPEDSEDIFGIMVGNQLIALLVYVICDIDNTNKRNRFIKEFCKRYQAFDVPDNPYVKRYCNELFLPKLPQYILELPPEEIYEYIRNGNRLVNFLDYIGRAFGIKRLTKKYKMN